LVHNIYRKNIFQILHCIVDLVTSNAICFEFEFSYHEFELYSFPFSPLQICGLIFFSRKQKKERRGSQQELQKNPWMIHMIEVLIVILLHHIPIKGLGLERYQLAHPLIKTSVLSLVDTFSIPINLVRSSQQFPFHLHQIVQKSFPDTKYTFFM